MNIERMKRHVGEPYELKLGEDVFRIPPLPSENIPELFGGVIFKIGNSLDDFDIDDDTVFDPKNIKKIMMNLDNETLMHVRNLICISCKNSPDVDSSDAKLFDQFISLNFMDLMSAVLEANSQTITTMSERTKKLMKRKHDKSTAESTATTPVSEEAKA